MKKAIIITGPTGVGKSALALHVARGVSGALISIDSIHVYQGCDIVSGKDIPQDSKRIMQDPPSISYWDTRGTPLYLTDIVPPTYEFSVADFLKATSAVLKEIERNNKTPVFVGGSTLYVRSLLSPIDTAMIPKDQNLRLTLEKATVVELQAILEKKNKPKLLKMNNSDVNNPRRLMRAIEIADTKPIQKAPTFKDYSFLSIGLEANRETLRDRIEIRINDRINSGAFNEAKKLFKIYSKLSNNIKSANGYKEIFEHLQHSTSKEEAIDKWRFSEFLHAKNQMTYLKKLSQLTWCDVEEENYADKLIHQVQKFIQN